MRVTTYTDRDEVHIILATLRSATDAKIVDNFAVGGMLLAVDLQSGKVVSDGIDEKMRTYVTHPVTGVALRGFQLPNWSKAMDVVRRASRDMYAMPQCRFLGWDIAFFKNGDVGIIECNWRQGVEIQMAHGRGIYYELDALRQKL